jgi:hypothetical protein
MDKNEIIANIYEEENYPGLEKLYKIIKKVNNDIKRTDVKKFLQQQLEYQLLKQKHKATRKNKLGHLTATFENEIWQIDIYDLSKYETTNSHFKYIFAVVDIFTRKAYIKPMKHKFMEDTTEALKSIIETFDIKPKVIMSDNDSSFLGSEFQNYLDENEIILDTNVLGDHNALGIIDNFAKRIKTILSAMYIKNNSTNWTNYIAKIIQKYNNTDHSSLNNISPNEAGKKKNYDDILNINLQKNLKNKIVSDLKIGDKVRIRLKDLFLKGTDDIFSDEVHQVKTINGKTITLDNDIKHKRIDLLLVPSNTESTKTNIIKVTRAKTKAKKILKQVGMDENNIIIGKRIKKTNKKYLN